jgi:hypothetical protein
MFKVGDIVRDKEKDTFNIYGVGIIVEVIKNEDYGYYDYIIYFSRRKRTIVTGGSWVEKCSK